MTASDAGLRLLYRRLFAYEPAWEQTGQAGLRCSSQGAAQIFASFFFGGGPQKGHFESSRPLHLAKGT